MKEKTSVMKKLLIITDMYPDEMNPVKGVFVHQQVMMLSRYYETMVIATSFSHPYKVIRSEAEGIAIRYIYFPLQGVPHCLSPLVYARLCLPRIKKEIKAFAPDIIHVHDCRHIPELYCLGSLLPKEKARKLVTLHNIRTHPDEIQSWLSRPFYKYSLLRALSHWDSIITVNQQLAEKVKRIVPHATVTALGNAIIPINEIPRENDSAKLEEIKQFLAPADASGEALKIITVGNLVPTKGFDLLLHALRKAIHKGTNAYLLIVGGGEEEKELHRITKVLKLEQHVFMSGRMSNTEVRNLYPLFDAFILPSWKETFGIVYLEAMEAGLITVGVQGQGIDGVIRHGQNGVLIPPKDIDATSKAIMDIGKGIYDRIQIVSAARQTVSDSYRMDKLVVKLKEIYES